MLTYGTADQGRIKGYWGLIKGYLAPSPISVRVGDLGDKAPRSWSPFVNWYTNYEVL